MKPSERIKQISKEINEKDPLGVFMGEAVIRTQAILDYLDEQWEANKTPEQRQQDVLNKS